VKEVQQPADLLSQRTEQTPEQLAQRSRRRIRIEIAETDWTGVPQKDAVCVSVDSEARNARTRAGTHQRWTPCE
jgi:hypothetical protein